MAVGNQIPGGFQQPPMDGQDLGGMMQPQAAPPMPAPQAPGQPGVAPPPDMPQRVSGWNNFFTALQQPGVSEALLMAGATMIQPIPMGGSAMGQFGKGVATGVQSLSNSQDTANELAIRRQGANDVSKRTEIYGQEVAQQGTGVADRHKESTAQLAVLQQNLIAAQRQNDPKQIALVTDQINAEIAKLKAQGESEHAQAGYYGRSQAGSLPAASVQEINQRAATLKANNPNLTDAQALQQAQQQSDSLAHPNDPMKMLVEGMNDARVRWASTMQGIQGVPFPEEETRAKIIKDIQMGQKLFGSPGASPPTDQPQTPPLTQPQVPASPGTPVQPRSGLSGLQADANAPQVNPQLPKATEGVRSGYLEHAKGKSAAYIKAMRDDWLKKYSEPPPTVAAK